MKITGVVLAGGFGTRLNTVLRDRQKVLAEVNGRPFVTILLDQLIAAGVTQIVLCTGHFGDQVQQTIGSSYRGVPVQYSQEREPLGTAGAVRQAFAGYAADCFLVLNGDSYVDADLSAFCAWHERAGTRGSLLLTWIGNCARYGTVEIEPNGRIVGFYEKRGRDRPGWISAGIYLLSRELLGTLPVETPLSFETQVFPKWLEEGISGYPVRCRFIDIGTPESLAAAGAFFDRGCARERRRFVVLDRDGTLIEQKNYLSSPDEVRLIPTAAAALAQLRNLGLGIVVATNQSGIGRGLFGMEDVAAVHDRMRELLRQEGASIDEIHICPHTPEEACACRKPRPGLLLRAAEALGFDPREAFMIGDKECDIDAGRNCGATTFLVRSGYGRQHLTSGQAKPDFVVDSLKEAADCIQAILGSRSMTLETKDLVVGAEERLRKHFMGSITTKQRVLDDCAEAILAAAGSIVGSLASGGKLLLCGNGGSAADCQHIAGEMVSVLNQSFPRPGLAAIALTTDSSIITASANDFGYEGIFERQVQALGKPGDVVMGISTSGNSENVCRALNYASRNGMGTIGLTGASGGKLTHAAAISICVPSANVQHVQEAHIAIGHVLCDLVERSLFAEGGLPIGNA